LASLWSAHIGEIWLTSVLRETGRYAVLALIVWLALWVVLSVPLRARKIRQDSPTPGRMAVEFLVSMRSIALFATVAVVQTLLSRAGAYPLSHMAYQWGLAWFWPSLVLMIIGHDAFYYWSHRAMHHPRMFRAFHRRHHRSMNPSPFTAYSFDLGEAALMASFVVIWPFVVPTAWPVVQLFLLHQIVRNTMAHCGYELMPARADGRPLLDWLTTTTHHDLHHLTSGTNFGLYFTWWDRWMGTEDPGYLAAFARAAHRPKPTPAPIPALADTR
jgi:sterol desaturase/sphingolipid hydroxylase (fatty acid hydroxylase superfamily)